MILDEISTSYGPILFHRIRTREKLVSFVYAMIKNYPLIYAEFTDSFLSPMAGWLRRGFSFTNFMEIISLFKIIL